MSERSMIPEGYYDAVAVPMAGEDGTALVRWGTTGEGQDKKTQCLIYFKVLEGPFAGTVLPWFGYFSKKAWERTVESLRYMGWAGDDIQDLGPLDQKVSISVEHNVVQKEGKPDRVYPRVNFVNKPGGGVIKMNAPLNRNQVAEFAAMMRNYVGRVPPVTGERVSRDAPAAGPPHPAANGGSPTTSFGGFGPPTGAPTGAPVADDDIPF